MHQGHWGGGGRYRKHYEIRGLRHAPRELGLRCDMHQGHWGGAGVEGIGNTKGIGMGVEGAGNTIKYVVCDMHEGNWGEARYAPRALGWGWKVPETL